MFRFSLIHPNLNCNRTIFMLNIYEVKTNKTHRTLLFSLIKLNCPVQNQAPNNKTLYIVHTELPGLVQTKASKYYPFLSSCLCSVGGRLHYIYSFKYTCVFRCQINFIINPDHSELLQCKSIFNILKMVTKQI